MSQINGIDVSKYQGNINWDILKNNSHVQFVFIRSSFGDGFKSANKDDYIDSSFRRNRDEARRVGIAHGFYHYAYPEYNQPEEEADYFIYAVGDLQRDELLALDFEEGWSGDYDDWTSRFLKRVQSHFSGYKGGLYTNPSHLGGHSWAKTVGADFWIWCALFDNNANVIPNTPFPVVAFKQYSDVGHEAGINGNVDEDVFYGDISVLKKYGYQPVSQLIESTPIVTPTTEELLKSAVADLGELRAKYQANSDLLSQAISDNQKKDVQISNLNAQIIVLNTQITSQNQTIQELQAKDEEYQNFERTVQHYESILKNSESLLERIFVNNKLGQLFLKLFNIFYKKLYVAIDAKLPNKDNK